VVVLRATRVVTPNARGRPMPRDIDPDITLLRMRLAFPREIYAPLVEPLLAFAACLRACAHIEATVDGAVDISYRRSVRLALRAVAVRHERILPPAAPPERVGDLAHRWTYAVLVAALLRHARSPGSNASVQPFNLLVPETGRQWLSEDPLVSEALSDVLTGRFRDDNPIEAILRAAASGTSPGTLWAIGEVGPIIKVVAVQPVPAVSALSAPETSPATASGAPARNASPSDDRASQFVTWLREGLANRSIALNTRGGLVHRVPEGLLLVWPDLFQSHLEAQCSELSTVRELKRLRQSLPAAGWHLEDSGGVLTHEYAWRNEDVVIGQMSGVVITMIEGLIDPALPINPRLARIDVSAGPGT
jgi:hypothetical protein